MNINTILKDVVHGKELTSEELLFLMETKNHGDEIIACADALNREANGDIVTFVHNRNINYTNICRNGCLFCAFRRNPRDPDGYVLSVGHILGKIAATPGISEVCIQGGILPGMSFSFVVDMVQQIQRSYPQIHIHAFSPMEIKYFSDISGRPIRSVITKLMECGLGSIPGTAAEILDDRIRNVICPEKVTTRGWVGIITTAHRLGLRSTATILIGHIETNDQVVRHMEIIREIQKKTGGFTEFIPLIFVPYATRLGEKFRINEMLSLRKVFKFYSLARIYFNGLITNIQASWPKLGFENAIKSLSAGVNDLGGTLYEENITRNAGGSCGQKVTIEEFRDSTNKAGKTPRERDTLYNLLPDHLSQHNDEPAEGRLFQGIAVPQTARKGFNHGLSQE